MVLTVGVSQEFIVGIFNHAESLLILLDMDLMFSENEHDGLDRYREIA